MSDESLGWRTVDWTGPVVSRLPAVVVSAVLVVGLLVWRFGVAADLPAFVWLGLVGVPLGFVDVALKRLPDHLTLPSYPIGLLLLGLAAPFTHDGGGRYLHALAGMGALLLIFGVQWFVAPGQIGLGDVKLSGVLGLYLGWLGLGAWIVGLFAMIVLGGAVSLVLLVTRRVTRKSTIPFGPFMLLGTLAAVLLYAA